MEWERIFKCHVLFTPVVFIMFNFVRVTFKGAEEHHSPEVLKQHREERINPLLRFNQVWIQTPGFHLELIWSSINPFYPKQNLNPFNLPHLLS